VWSAAPITPSAADICSNSTISIVPLNFLIGALVRYSWVVLLDGAQTIGKQTFILFSPHREEECSDENIFEAAVHLTHLALGWHKVKIQVYEEVISAVSTF